jgi:hypothetical protein
MDGVRRYPGLGGLAAWRVPLLGGGIALGAAAAGDWVLVVASVVLGIVLEGLDRSVVLEVSPRGLARAFAVGGALVGPARAVAWDRVEEVRTSWRRPRDFTGLVTTVVGGDGADITFGTEMGLKPYSALVVEVVRRAPRARRTGLTERVVAETVPARVT